MLVQRYRDKSKEVFQQKANSAGGFCLALRMSRTVGASTWPTRSLCQLMLLNHLMGKDEELYWSIIQRVGRKLNDLGKSSKGTQTVQLVNVPSNHKGYGVSDMIHYSLLIPVMSDIFNSILGVSQPLTWPRSASETHQDIDIICNISQHLDLHVDFVLILGSHSKALISAQRIQFIQSHVTKT